MNAVHRPAWRLFLVALAGILLTAPALATNSGVFLENIGQFDDAVAYRTTIGTTVVWLTEDGIVLDLVDPSTLETPSAAQAGLALPGDAIDTEPARRSGCVVRIRFGDSAPGLVTQGHLELAAPTHFLLGNDPIHWYTGARSFAGIAYRDVWPGIDLVWRVAPGGLEYEVITQPGADAANVRFEYEGQAGLVSEADVVRLETSVGTVVHRLPAPGTATGAIVLGDSGGPPPSRSSFAFGWCTFLGGTTRDQAQAVTADALGRPIAAGQTRSPDFPTTPGAYDDSLNTSGVNYADAFVTKLTEDGSGLEWSTYLGGSEADDITVLLVDSQQNVVAVGNTQSPDFPTTPGAFDETASTPVGDYDVFVTKLAPDGASLVWSTYLGKGKYDVAVGATLDSPADDILITGHTLSPGFPTTPGALKETHPGDPYRDGYVTKLAAAGDALVWSTLIGPDEASDWAFAVELVEGSPVVVGWTESPAFWTTPGAYDETFNGTNDGYILKLSPAGDALVWSTYMGGSTFDFVSGLGLDPLTGDLLVVGRTDSEDFPVTFGAFDQTFNGILDVVVLRLSGDGSSLIWSTYLGGDGGTGSYAGDWPWDLDVGPNGTAVLAGATGSADFPVTSNAPYPTHSGGPHDGFITIVSPDGSDLLLSTFCGGSTDATNWEGFNGYENVEVIEGRVYVVGQARSIDFPVSDGAWDTELDGVVDAVVVNLTLPATDAPEIPAATADRLQLACSPNPFRGVTEIHYSLPVASAVEITVHEVGGRLVRTLGGPERAIAGPHRLSWDGRDDTGLLAAGGVYFVRVKTADREESERVVLLR